MTDDFLELVTRYGMPGRVVGIIHAGAHVAEEARVYFDAFGAVPVWWIEANPAVIRTLRAEAGRYPNQRVIEALLSDVDGEKRDFHVTSNDGESSSLLEFGTHSTLYPNIVFVDTLTLLTRTLDSLVTEHGITANMLVMDLQGAEGLCLAGASRLLPSLDFILSEVNKTEIYKGCVKVWELDKMFADLERVETLWCGDEAGNALWVRSR